jgi:hypothetical protein
VRLSWVKPANEFAGQVIRDSWPFDDAQGGCTILSGLFAMISGMGIMSSGGGMMEV